MDKAALRKRLLELELEKAEREQKAQKLELQKAQKTKQPSAILAPACRFFRSGSCAKGKDCPFSHLVRGKDCRFSHVPPSVTHTSATPLCSEVLLSDFVRLYVCHTGLEPRTADARQVHYSHVRSNFGQENWPQGHAADRISAAEAATSGTVRHDLLVEAGHDVGRIIGREGKTLRGICESTGCEIFVFDQEGAPPDTVRHLRLVSLVGLPMAVCNANKAVSNVIAPWIGQGGGRGVQASLKDLARRNPYGDARSALGDGCPIEYVCPACGCGEARRSSMIKHLQRCSPKLLPMPKGPPNGWAHLKVVGWHLTRSAAVRAPSDVAPPRVRASALSIPCAPCRSAGQSLHQAWLRVGGEIGRGRCEGLARAPLAP